MLKTEYNKALNRYNNMIENVPEEKQQTNYKYVEEIINNCNKLLNEIKKTEKVTYEEIIGGFR